MLFLGTSEHTVDDRGRVAIPSRYRGMLGSTVIISKGPDPCLEVYTPEAYEQRANHLLSGMGDRQNDRRLRRAFFSQSTEAEIDKQGRILIPAPFRQWADISGAVVIAGNGPVLELWAASRWSGEADEAQQDYAQMLESREARA